MGRPTSLDDLVQKRICDAARRGNSRECSAVLGGIDPRTVRGWIRRARDDEEPFASFFSALQKAEREAEDEMVQLIRGGAERWQAAAWWLERRRRNTWRRPAQEKVREEPADAGADVSQLSDDQLLEAVRAAQELRARKAVTYG